MSRGSYDVTVRNHNTGVVSSNPARHNKAQLMGRATGNHLIKSTSLEKLRAQSLVSVTLEIECAMQIAGNHLMKFISLEKLRAQSQVSATLEIECTTQCKVLLAGNLSVVVEFKFNKAKAFQNHFISFDIVFLI